MPYTNDEDTKPRLYKGFSFLSSVKSSTKLNHHSKHSIKNKDILEKHEVVLNKYVTIYFQKFSLLCSARLIHINMTHFETHHLKTLSSNWVKTCLHFGINKCPQIVTMTLFVPLARYNCLYFGNFLILYI